MRGIIHYVKILEKRPPDVTVREWRRIRHETMKAMGLKWHAEMLPNHFAPNASNVYKYKRRSKAHEERKQRGAKSGRDGQRQVDPRAGTDALTFTGTLRRNVTQVATIRSFEQRFKLVMPGTAYTPARPRSANQPPIAQEVTTLLQREKEELAKFGKSLAAAQLRQYRESRTTEIT